MSHCPTCQADEAAQMAHELERLKADNVRVREALRLFLNRSNQDVRPEKTWEETIAFGWAAFSGKDKP